MIRLIDMALKPFPEAVRRAFPEMLHSLASTLECCAKPRDMVFSIERLRRELR